MKTTNVKNLKGYTFAAVLAGVLALPLVANAEGTAKDARNQTGAAQSASPSTTLEQDFTALDADRSGTISKSEFDNGDIDGDFAELDTNKDGQLTLAELRNGNAAYQRSSVQ